MKDTLHASAAALLIVGALAACTDVTAGGEAFELADSAGIAVARNFAPPADTFRLAEPTVRIGMVEGPEEYLFELISDVQPLPDGRVAVVDNRGARVALFDRDGRWVRDLGGRGDGPGEYRTPLRVWVDESELVVLDYIPRRLLRYSPAGEFMGGDRVEWKSAPSPLYRTGDVWVDEREWGQHPADERPAGGALVRISEQGAVQDTIVGPYPTPQTGYEVDGRGMMTMVNPPTFSASPSWAAREDRIYWTPGAEPRIEVRSVDGTPERIVHLAPGGDRVTAEDRHAWRTAMQERWGVPEEALGDVEFAEDRPALTGLVVADDGRLWAATFDPSALPGEPGRGWHVLDAEGRVERHVLFPAGFRLFRVSGGRAYGVGVTAEDVELVEVFEVREGRA